MAEAAARPEASEKVAFLGVRLKAEEGNDFPREIPKEAKAKAREKDIYVKERKKIFQRAKILLPEVKIFVSKFW